METIVWFNSSLSIIVEAVLYEDGTSEKSLFSVNDDANISTLRSEWKEVPLLVMEALLVEMGMPPNEDDDECEPINAAQDIDVSFTVEHCQCRFTVLNGNVAFYVNNTYTIDESLPIQWRKRIVLKAVRLFQSYTLTLQEGVKLKCDAYDGDGQGSRRRDFYTSLGFTRAQDSNYEYDLVYVVGE